MATAALARLQTVYVILNVMYVFLMMMSPKYLPVLTLLYRLCLAVIIALPAATPSEFKNTAKFALGDFTNRKLQRNLPFKLYLPLS